MVCVDNTSGKNTDKMLLTDDNTSGYLTINNTEISVYIAHLHIFRHLWTHCITLLPRSTTKRQRYGPRKAASAHPPQLTQFCAKRPGLTGRLIHIFQSPAFPGQKIKMQKQLYTYHIYLYHPYYNTLTRPSCIPTPGVCVYCHAMKIIVCVWWYTQRGRHRDFWFHSQKGQHVMVSVGSLLYLVMHPQNPLRNQGFDNVPPYLRWTRPLPSTSVQ